LPRGPILEADEHLLLVRVGAELVREGLVDAALAGVRIDRSPDRLAALAVGARAECFSRLARIIGISLPLDGRETSLLLLDGCPSAARSRALHFVSPGNFGLPIEPAFYNLMCAALRRAIRTYWCTNWRYR
jgi:hypothetical protein